MSSGDLVYPIAVHAQALFVLGRLRVAEIRTYTPATIGRLHQEHVDRHPRWRFLADSCVNEAVIGAEGTVLRLDAAMPPEILRRLTYRSQDALVQSAADSAFWRSFSERAASDH